jgi:hypothetical protein
MYECYFEAVVSSPLNPTPRPLSVIAVRYLLIRTKISEEDACALNIVLYFIIPEKYLNTLRSKL